MISFFTHSGGAGKIRGEQIAKYIRAKLNPKDGYEDDVCIYVKCIPPLIYPKKTYIDVVEDSAGLRWIKSHPKIGIIASSKSIFKYLSDKLPNNLVLISQHHCNFERVLRTRKEVKVAGIIGNSHAFQYPLDRLEEKLKNIGIELRLFVKKTFGGREEVVDFYKQIDIQLVWRPNTDGVLRNPLKLINACSFGIPTVAYPEVDFVTELDGYFLQAKNIDDLIKITKKLKDNSFFYEEWSDKALFNAEDYHIDNISKFYRQL